MAYQNMYSQYNPYPNQNYSNPYYQGYNNYGNYGNFTNNQQTVQQQPIQQTVQQNNQNSGFQWVQGEAAAKAFHVEPGQTVLLMDSDSPVLYFKSSDVTGRPTPMIIYDLVERKELDNQQNFQNIDLSAYLKKDELEGIINDIVEKSVAKRMSEMKPSTSVPTVMPVKSSSKKGE